MDVITYLDQPGCVRLSNDTIDVIVATAVGPRVLRCGFAAGPNLLGEYPDLVTETALGPWKPLGGHRLWAAPEQMPGSYAPDDRPLTWQMLDERSISLRQNTDTAGIEKALLVRVAPSGGRVTLQHEIRNRGRWPIEIAPWALTIVAPGGTAVIPQPLFRSHDQQLLPVRSMALWPFTDLSDPRWRIGSRLIRLTPDPHRPAPQKLGVMNERGWCACVWPDAILVKHFDHNGRGRYPDFGSNTEVYAEGAYLELETLGCLELLAPGEAVSHVERWSLFPGLDPLVVDDEHKLEEALVELATASVS